MAATQWIMSLRGGTPAQLAHWHAPHVQVFSGSLQLSELLPNADLVVTQGGQGMVSAALLAGKPLLLLPKDAETWLTATQEVRLGAGINANAPEEQHNGRTATTNRLSSDMPGSTSSMQKALAHAVNNPEMLEAAKVISQRWARRSSEAVRVDGQPHPSKQSQ